MKRIITAMMLLPLAIVLSGCVEMTIQLNADESITTKALIKDTKCKDFEELAGGEKDPDDPFFGGEKKDTDKGCEMSATVPKDEFLANTNKGREGDVTISHSGSKYTLCMNQASGGGPETPEGMDGLIDIKAHIVMPGAITKVDGIDSPNLSDDKTKLTLGTSEISTPFCVHSEESSGSSKIIIIVIIVVIVVALLAVLAFFLLRKKKSPSDAGPMGPGQPGQPMGPGPQGQPMMPGQPGQPMGPGQPMAPGQPAQPMGPGPQGQPMMPGQPMGPGPQGQPGQPMGPGQPMAPGQPAQPMGPGQQGQPMMPGQPMGPGPQGQPGQPMGPGQPVPPEQPMPPAQPGKPGPGEPFAPRNE